MKKLLLFIAMLIIPFAVYAEGDDYEYFDFRFEQNTGDVIKDTDVKIFASVSSDIDNLVDRTDEFIVEALEWRECVDDLCEETKEITDDQVYEDGKDYYFRMYINPKDETRSFNVWSSEKVMINGTSSEELGGGFGNSGSLGVYSKAGRIGTPEVIDTFVPDYNPEEEDSLPEVIAEPEVIEEPQCMFGISLCCTMFLGLSICIWIIIAIIILLLIIIAVACKSKKRKNK